MKKNLLYRVNNKNTYKGNFAGRRVDTTRMDKSDRSMNRNHGRVEFNHSPLYQFLLVNVGRNIDDIISEVKPRLNNMSAFWWVVKNPLEVKSRFNNNKDQIARVGENGYWSTFSYGEDKILYINQPNFSISIMELAKMQLNRGETFSFNGVGYNVIGGVPVKNPQKK